MLDSLGVVCLSHEASLSSCVYVCVSGAFPAWMQTTCYGFHTLQPRCSDPLCIVVDQAQRSWVHFEVLQLHPSMS